MTETKTEIKQPAAPGTQPPASVLKAVEPAKAGKKKTKKTAGAKKVSVRQAADAKQTTSKMEKTMTKGKNQFDSFTQDAVKGGKEQVDAVIQTGNVFMKGFEDMTKACMSWAQSSAEKNSQAVKALMSCKTINEFAETQNKWAQQNFDDFMAGATKMSELGVRVTTEALEPINDQFSKSIRKAVDSMAA